MNPTLKHISKKIIDLHYCNCFKDCSAIQFIKIENRLRFNLFEISIDLKYSNNISIVNNLDRLKWKEY